MPKTLSDQDIADFRDRLCDVAERLFAEHGPEAVTMRQLAAELKVSPMTPYRYFQDKDAMMAAVRARGFSRHADALEAAYASSSGTSLERSGVVAEAYVRFALENPQAYKLMFDFQQPTMANYPELVAAASRSKATMTAHLKSSPDAAKEGPGERDLIGHVFWSGLHGAIMLHLTGMLAPPNDLVSITRRMREVMIKGIMSGKA